MIILKLVLMVPRSVIFDFVNVMYRSAAVEEEELEDETNVTTGTKQKKAGFHLKSTDVTEIVPDRNYGTFFIFMFGLFALCLPAIVHCAWRLTENSLLSDRLDIYNANANLFIAEYSLRWKEQELYSTQCPDMTFCLTFNGAKTKLDGAKTEVNYFSTQCRLKKLSTISKKVILAMILLLPFFTAWKELIPSQEKSFVLQKISKSDAIQSIRALI